MKNYTLLNFNLSTFLNITSITCRWSHKSIVFFFHRLQLLRILLWRRVLGLVLHLLLRLWPSLVIISLPLWPLLVISFTFWPLFLFHPHLRFWLGPLIGLTLGFRPKILFWLWPFLTTRRCFCLFLIKILLLPFFPYDLFRLLSWFRIEVLIKDDIVIGLRSVTGQLEVLFKKA